MPDDPSFVVRQFQRQDLPAVHEIFSNGFKEYTGQTALCSPYFAAAKLKEDMRDIEESYLNAGGNFWVAEDVSVPTNTPNHQPKIIGIVGVLPVTATTEEEADNKAQDHSDDEKTRSQQKVFELQRMSVVKAYHGKGVAQLLVRRLEKFAFEEQMCSKVFLTTGIDMEVAKRFYEKQGYDMTHTESESVGDYTNELPKDFKFTWQRFEKSSRMYFL